MNRRAGPCVASVAHGRPTMQGRRRPCFARQVLRNRLRRASTKGSWVDSPGASCHFHQFHNVAPHKTFALANLASSKLLLRAVTSRRQPAQAAQRVASQQRSPARRPRAAVVTAASSGSPARRPPATVVTAAQAAQQAAGLRKRQKWTRTIAASRSWALTSIWQSCMRTSRSTAESKRRRSTLTRLAPSSGWRIIFSYQRQPTAGGLEFIRARLPRLASVPRSEAELGNHLSQSNMRRLDPGRISSNPASVGRH